MTTINERIKELRMSKKITLGFIAKELNITEATAYRYESGDIKNIPSDRIEAYAKILNTSPAYLMGWDTSENEKDSLTPTSYDSIEFENTLSKLDEENFSKVKAYTEKVLELQELEK